VPVLTKLQATIGERPRYDLDAIIRDVVEWKRSEERGARSEN
jgi:hypothetical protein